MYRHSNGHQTLGRLPSHHNSSYAAGQNNGKYATLSKQCKTLESNDFYWESSACTNAGSTTCKIIRKYDTLTKTKSSQSNINNSIDRCDSVSREIPLNGFNRFDPKYISIGPKALRESLLTSTNLNKCATLRHGGRYGGNLNAAPVLKKATPPSVTTVSKDYNAQTENITNSLSINNNNSIDFKTVYDDSNVSQPKSIAFVSGYETDNGTTFPYKRPPFKHSKFVNATATDSRAATENQKKTKSVYSITNIQR